MDDDGGKGHLGTYTVNDDVQDFDASFNDDMYLTFSGVSPDPDGTLTLRIEVSHSGNSRFAVINALSLTNTGP